MRIHVASLPFEPQPQCAYGTKATRFVRMLGDRGHDIFHHESSAADWDPARRFDPDTEHWQAWNALCVSLIRGNLQPDDIICIIAGRCQQAIIDAFPNHLVCEPFCGYGGVASNYVVYESYAWMHTVYGSQTGGDAHRANGRFYDAVIPNYFDVADFPAGDGGDGYAYVGRLTARKGVSIAIDVCSYLDAPLTIAGEGDLVPTYGDCVGVVGPTQRAKIMGSAKAVFVPTIYVEPFGGVAVEAQLCGTPVISTDWGGMSETVEHGVTGFRCRTLQEFVDAARNAEFLDRDLIREKAIARWSLEAIAPQFETYFQRLLGLRGAGWPDLSNDVGILV